MNNIFHLIAHLNYRLITIAVLTILGVIVMILLVMQMANNLQMRVYSGKLMYGHYLIEIPSRWNGTLVLYSHGTRSFTNYTVVSDAGTPLFRAWLLNNGYAIAGSSDNAPGWVLKEQYLNQVETLHAFMTLVGKPEHTIFSGASQGGAIVSVLAEKNANAEDGAFVMCGRVDGAIARFNQSLDEAFAFKQLLASQIVLPLIHQPKNKNYSAEALSILKSAQATPLGRARTALIAALGERPTWFNPFESPPESTDYLSQEKNQYYAIVEHRFGGSFGNARSALETDFGGNPSWNTGVDYAQELEKSPYNEEVINLYKIAHGNLTNDLSLLNSAPRISADSQALANMITYVGISGNIAIPILTLHTTDDNRAIVEVEQAYENRVGQLGKQDLLRELFVHRPGHCAFTTAEQTTAFMALIQRVDSGEWGDLRTESLNATANTFQKQYYFLDMKNTKLNTKPFKPNFVHYSPAEFLRPFYI